MTMLLKQSTAKAVSFGPFVDITDGATLETGLVSALDHASTGIMLSKNGGALTIRHATVTASTYDAYGNYIVTLDTTDTNTLGTLRMQYAGAAPLPVFQDFMVVPANVYDSLVAGSDLLDISAVQLNGGAQSLTDLKDFADTGYDPATHKVAGVVLADTVTAVTGLTASDVGAVKSKTDNLPSDPADESLIIAATDAIMSRLGAPAGASHAADTAAVKSDTAAIKTKTDSLTFSQAGLADVNVQKINDVTIVGDGSGTPFNV